MKSYAFNYRPQQQTFGQPFLYDGEHDFEYWKLTHPDSKYEDYWHGIRDAYVKRNFNIVESLTQQNNLSPVTNFTTGFSEEQRIAQTILSHDTWKSVNDITHGTGTIMSFDLETIGNVWTKHQNASGKNIQTDYAGITEIGFHFRKFKDGVVQEIANEDTFTLVVGLNSKQISHVKDVVNAYNNSGFEALDSNGQWLIRQLSRYGHSADVNKVFEFKPIDQLGGKFMVLSSATELAEARPLDGEAVRRGFKNLSSVWGEEGKYYNKNFEKVQNAVIKLINENINDPNTAIISANAPFEATILSDLGLDGEKYIYNSADIVSANTAIARSKNMSVYNLQRSANLSHGVTGDKPASEQNAMNAAGLDEIERHSAGLDARNAVDVAVNKSFYGDDSFAEAATKAGEDLGIHGKKPTDPLKPSTIDYNDTYFYLRNGYLDKNKLDHAVVDGKPTQSYSIRGRFYRIDKEHSNYAMVPKQIPDPKKTGEYILSDPEKVYVLSLIDDNGNRISKQFETEQHSLTWLTQNSSIMSTNDIKRREGIRNTHTEVTEMDWGRRVFDGFFNPNDIRVTNRMNQETKSLEEINGFSDLKKYLDIVDDIDTQIKSGKTLEEIATPEYLENYGKDIIEDISKKIKSGKTFEEIIQSDYFNKQGNNLIHDIQKEIADSKNKKTFEDIVNSDFLDELGIKGNYQQTAFTHTYKKIKSEESVLREIVNYIDINMPNANNLQKTVALRDIRQAYINHIQNDLGYTPYSVKTNRKENIALITDALGIDVKVGNEYKRIHGDSLSTIQSDLNRVFAGHSRKDIIKSLEDLQKREVLSEDITNNLIKSIKKNTTPRNTYYSTVFEDIAIKLNEIVEPIAKYESPIAFFNKLDAKNITDEHKTAIRNKLVNPTTYDTVHLLAQSQYVKNPKDSSILLTNIFENEKEELKKLPDTLKNILKTIGADDIISRTEDISFIKNINETLNELGKNLGYSSNEIDILKQMFIPGKSEKSQKYAIFGKDRNLQSFIINPSDKNTSAFILITNDKHASKVANMLSSGDIEKYIKENDLEYLSRANVAEIFKGQASVVELKQIKRTDVMTSFSDLYDEGGKYIAELFGGNTSPQIVTMNQGQNLEKFMIPSINVYRGEDNIISGNLLESGEEFLTAYRMTGERLLDEVENDNFDTANYLITKSQNNVLKNSSSPSSYRGFNGKRVANYNYNDVSHGFYFDASGLKETFKLQVENIIDDDNVESPLYRILQYVGLATGDLQEEKIGEKISKSSAERIMESAGFNEFFAKNILTGQLSNDLIVSERLSLFSNIKREAFNKNILGVMIDEMKTSPDSYSKEFIDMFEKIQNASPYMTQILNETNTHNFIFSFLRSGDIIDFGLINSPMRPTYGQVLNAIRFNPESLDKNIMDALNKDDVLVGPVSRTKVEQSILETFGKNFTAPSGKKYSEEERLIMTPFKQMNDMDLVLRYKELDETITNFATSDADAEKLKYAYNIFKQEHVSLYEGKWFGAPMLLNQEPFSSSDIKKVKIGVLQNHKDKENLYKLIEKDWLTSSWDKDKKQWVRDRKITQGDTLVRINGHSVLWEGPDTYLTKENIDELFNAGETRVIPSNRMISDIKMMAQQEKATVHFALIDDQFMKKHGDVFDNEKEALEYMQRAFDAVSGYNPEMGYRPMLIGNLSSYKHGTAISLDSTFRVIAHEYEKDNEINTLIDKLRKIEYFEDWKFEKQVVNGREILISNQLNAKGAEEAINQLYDSIMNGTSETDKRIQKVFKFLNENDIAYLESQRMLVNEIMGSKVMLDERMMQSIRMRALERPYQEERSFEDLYIDSLKDSVRKHYYEHGSMISSTYYDGEKKIRTYDPNLYALHSAMDEVAEDSINASKMHIFNEAISSQEKTIYSLNESLMFYVNGIDVDESDILKVNIDDILKNLPEKHITRDDVEDLMFYKNGHPSNLIKSLAGDRPINNRSIYLDFGTVINASDILKGKTEEEEIRKTFSGVLVPIFDVQGTSEDELFFTQSQKALTRFLNAYKENIGKKDGKQEITKAIDNLYKSFAREMNPYDKDSLAAKTTGKLLLPHSAQSLAQDEVAPIVDAMFDDDYVRKLLNDEKAESLKSLLEQEKEIRQAVVNGDFSRVNDIDNIVEARKTILSKIADEIEKSTNEIENENQSDKLFHLTQLSLTGDEYKGYEIINDKKYFANAFEMNAKNFKRHGLDTGLVGYQIFEDAFYMRDIGEIYQGSGTLVKFESNAKFDKFLKDGEGIQKRILQNLKEQGLEFDDGKQLLRQLNEAITEDMGRKEKSEFITKVYNSMSFLGEQYLHDVGIISREVWRPPVFSAQVPGRIYLNNNVGDNQLRALTGGTTSVINNVDFDGDMYMLSLSLNGNGGLRTMFEDSNLRNSYMESLKVNNKIMAQLIRDGEAFKKNSLSDIAYYRLEQLKAFDADLYEKGMLAWADKNNIKITSLDKIPESQKLRAAHSEELRNAYATFSSKGNMLTNENVIKAAIVARIRKDNIGSISTPNYKVRSSLFILKNGIIKDKTLSEAERKEAFSILQDLTGIDSSKLLDITEQKSIDVKHIFDAVNIAETPKWAKGMSMLFGKQEEEGLRLMLTAVNNSTFAFKNQKELDTMFNKIINTSRDDLRKGLDKLEKGSTEYARQNFALQFRALYDASHISHAKEVHKYILRNKNAVTRDFAEELVNIDKLKKQYPVLFRDSAEGDFLDLLTKSGLDSRFKGNENYLYFLPGSLRNHRDISNVAYMIDKVHKSNVTLEKVNIDGEKIIRTGEKIRLSDNPANYKKLNSLLDKYVGVNAYQYLNGLSKEGIDLEVSRRKIANTMTDMILEKDGKIFNSYFHKMGGEAILKYGPKEYNFLGVGFNKTTIANAREILNDYKYYVADMQLDNAPGVHALIKDINKAIAEKYTPDGDFSITTDYDSLVRKYITTSIDGISISENGLREAHEERMALGKFDIGKYKKQKSFLDNNLYDIIGAEEKLNESFNTLTNIYNKALEEGVELPNGLKDTITNKDKTISETLANIKALNKKTIKQTQDNIYGLFKNTNQMDIVFKWNKSISNKTIVGFGEFLGKSFGELSTSNIESILSASVSGATDKEKYAIQTTQNLLRQYVDSHDISKVKGIVRKNIHDSVNVITEHNEQFRHSFNIDFIRKAINESATPNRMQRKSISGGFFDSLKNINPSTLKTVGIVAGSLAALGVANNLLHKDKHKSPVSPEFSNDHNDPGFKNNSVQSPQVAPPSKKTIYVDKPSGFNFKISAKTNNYISDVNNAKLIGLANGGHANVYSQQDTSGVTDNWLANKFAELT